ncbi:structure-specific recognition protein-domain-containing protein [Collybia nuda]|uniref:FACT complex subunit POB3 n=1 Tax=Collybia nuda TaxID=64659 RepID=A0A9P5XSG6_9AGAR|nr:structure-specific recognition protein-domain-containing protein [Collybia nuda]
MTPQFDTIYYGLSQDAGKFRVAASGVAWRAGETMTAIPASDIKYAQWSRVARGFRVSVGTAKGYGKSTFDGFMREDYDTISDLFEKHFEIALESRETTFKGWNWGATDFQGSDELVFTVSNKLVLELPLGSVSNVNISGKNEVTLEFGGSGTDVSQELMLPDALVEIRFYVPASSKEKENSGSGSDDGDDLNAAEIFHKTIKEKSGTYRQTPSAVILNFDEVLLLTPRGRYDMDMCLDSFRLRGKTYDYRVFYSNISRMFLLPKDNLHLLFIIGLESPIRQGQTCYDYLVIQYERSQEMSTELNVTKKDLEKYPLLKKSYDGPAFEVITEIFRALVGKIIIQGSNFKSHKGANFAIKANLKAMLGELFMLDKCILFVARQPTIIGLGNIYTISFSRVDRTAGVAAARTFDLTIVTRSGPDQAEYRPIETYLRERKVKIKNDVQSDVDLYPGGSDSGFSDAFKISTKGRLNGTRRNTTVVEDSEEDAEFQGSSSDGESSVLDSGSSDGDAETVSDASGDREFFRRKNGMRKDKIKKKGTFTTSGSRNGTASAASTTKSIITKALGSAHNQSQKHPKLQRSIDVSHDCEIDVVRPKKKLKMRA